VITENYFVIFPALLVSIFTPMDLVYPHATLLLSFKIKWMASIAKLPAQVDYITIKMGLAFQLVTHQDWEGLQPVTIIVTFLVPLLNTYS